MTLRGMEDFDLTKEVKQIDTVCEKHGTRLVEFSGRTLCPDCAAELTREREKEVVHERTKAYYERDKHYIDRSLTPDYSLFNKTFENFLTPDEETTINKEKARKLAGSYLKGRTFNVVLAGKAGTGKSHLAMAILKGVNDYSTPRRKCLFVSVDELIAQLRDGYDHKDVPQEYDLRRMCTEADVLVLDDLGAEGPPDRPAAGDVMTLLNGIINGRTNKSTIITTNLSSKQVYSRYADRIASRMYKGVGPEQVIQFKHTPDKRQRIEH